MCGICGIVKPLGVEAGRGLVEAMADRIAHRGPDGEGFWSSDDGAGVYFGHRRLAVIDLEGSAQPFLDPGGRAVLVYNGEIYNFRELRRELEALGHAFTTRGDTEVVLRAWLEWGEASVERLRGMFAIAIWDRVERRLFLARDPLGKKPLYYRLLSDGIAFASEIKALLADPGYTPRPNYRAIDRYLELLYVDGTETALEGIDRLPPASYMVWRDGHVRTERYWNVDLTPRAEMDPEEAADELRARFDEAVRIRLVSDVPLGALLSGGLDSSLVVAHMARHGDRPVETFSVGFGEAIDELPKARAVAERYATAHHEMDVGAPGVELVERMAEIYDEPFADSSNIPTYLLSRFAREHVTVALTGDGGDELFAGYHRHLYLWLGESLDPNAVRQRWEGMLVGVLQRAGWRPSRRGEEEPYAYRAWRRTNELHRRRRMPDPWERVSSLWHGMGSDRRRALWRDGLEVGAEGSAFSGRPAPESALEACLEFDLKNYLPGDLLVKMDMASMATSLEVRSPFLDHRLVEFAVGLPFRLRLGSGRTKDFLRRAFASDLPPRIVRQGKMGFGAPISEWVTRSELRHEIETIFDSSSSFLSQLFRRDALEEIRTSSLANGSRSQDLWMLMMLELWARRMNLS